MHLLFEFDQLERFQVHECTPSDETRSAYEHTRRVFRKQDSQMSIYYHSYALPGYGDYQNDFQNYSKWCLLPNIPHASQIPPIDGLDLNLESSVLLERARKSAESYSLMTGIPVDFSNDSTNASPAVQDHDAYQWSAYLESSPIKSKGTTPKEYILPPGDPFFHESYPFDNQVRRARLAGPNLLTETQEEDDGRYSSFIES